MKRGDAIVDGWTLVHLFTGYLFGRLRLHPLLAIALFALFEFWEATQRAKSNGEGSGVFENESYFNIAGDMAANWLGFTWGLRS